MKVILKHDIANLGEEGDIKEVANGYARNFLLPKGMVEMFGKAALNNLERKKEQIEKKKEAKRVEAKTYKAQLEKEEIEFNVPSGEKSRLFGAITSANIVEALVAKGIVVERKKIEVPDSAIKSLGNYNIRIRLYGDEVATLKVVVKSNNRIATKTEREEAKSHHKEEKMEETQSET